MIDKIDDGFRSLMWDLVMMVVNDLVMMTDGLVMFYKKVLNAGRKHQVSCVDSNCREHLKLSFVESSV